MNSADTTYAGIVETTKGTTPATGAWLPAAHIEGSNGLNVTSNMIASETKTSTRDSLGQRVGSETADGGLDFELRNTDFIKAALASALSGTWASKKLKAGVIDTALTIRKRMLTTANTPIFTYFRGEQASKVTISGEAGQFLKVAFEFTGMAAEKTATPIAALTEATESANAPLAATDLGTVSIGSFTGIDLASFSIMVGHSRNADYRMGSKAVRSISTSGKREVSGEIKIYKEDLSVENGLTDAGIAIVLTLGATGNGFKITIPRATCSYPTDELGNSVYSVISFTGALSPTDGTGIIIEEL